MFSSNSSQVSSDANYIESCFSTYLYTGNSSTQTITNGIDLAGKGGLVWIKDRSSAQSHNLYDTLRGATKRLVTNATLAQITNATSLTSFNTDGFSSGAYAEINASGDNYASWTFRKAPKFFDVVTYTGNGSTQNIAHNLGSVPGCIIVKEASAAGNDWQVYHRSTTNTCGRLFLNLTNAENANGRANTWGDNTNPVPPTSTVFTVGNTGAVNNNGATFVAYLFAHNAGGFGLTGTDNVITCGSYTGNGSTSGPTVTLGYEPQWVMIKRTDSTGNWVMIDSMRGFVNSTTASPSDAYLVANTSAAESTWGDFTGTSNAAIPLATGFQIVTSTATLNANAGTYIYIAIRRGPMKVPTSGTSVFSPNQTSGTTGTQITTGFPVDWQLLGMNDGNVYNQRSSTRLTGVNTDGTSNSQYLVTSNTNAEAATGSVTLNWGSTGFQVPSLNSGSPTIFWNFRRAPSFFDEVCYTGTGSARTVAHNLGVAPEMMITKVRTGSSTSNWAVYHKALGATDAVYLDLTDATTSWIAFWNNTAPTASVFSVGGSSYTNNNGGTLVAYLFATCAGVSKVGSYTGTGTTQQINCGFTGGARFVLIKRTDSTGAWYVWDSARGIVAGNDPYLLLNSTAAEVTNTDYIDTYSAGFEISSTAPAAINASGGSFIFLAIA